MSARCGVRRWRESCCRRGRYFPVQASSFPWPAKVVDKHGTRKVAEAYLQFLYSDQGPELIAKNYYRPAVEKAGRKYAAQFPNIKLFTIDEVFGGWGSAQKKHLADGGTFDQIYQPGKK